MCRSWIAGCLTVVAGALLITACSSDSRSPTEPAAPPVSASIVPAGCPSIGTTAGYITTLFPKPQRLVAAASYAAVLLYINTGHLADAQTLVFRLIDYTFAQFNAGNLIGGSSLTTRQTLLAFEMGLYCTVGLSTSGLTLPGVPGDPGTVNEVIFPSANSQLVITLNGNAAVLFPPNSVGGAGVVVAITPIAPPTFPAGPLNTKLDQYGNFSDIKVTPESSLLAKVTVGVCLTNGSDIPTVFLAHNNSATTIEVLPPGLTISGLCTVQTASISGREMLDFAMRGQIGRASAALGSAVASFVLPENAYAGSGGKTGLASSFSPFGGVDTKVYMTANSPTSQTAPAGSPVASPPSALVKTGSGAPMTEGNVQFSVTAGGGTVAGGSSSTVATNANGVATVSNWVINAGANTVQATYADPTVSFAAAPANSGFPQAVLVDPSGGITFNAIGGDVVPYGSSYLYLDGAHGFDPTFFTPGFSTTGFHTGNGPFGTSSTTCPLNSDPAINLAFAVDTDILLIKTFPLPSGWTAPLTIEAAIDNDIAVWVNGHALTTVTGSPLYAFTGPDAVNYSFDPTSGFVTHENCATKGSLTFTVPASFLVAGQNTLAIRAQDRGGLTYVDAKVTQAPTQ